MIGKVAPAHRLKYGWHPIMSLHSSLIEPSGFHWLWGTVVVRVPVLQVMASTHKPQPGATCGVSHFRALKPRFRCGWAKDVHHIWERTKLVIQSTNGVSL